MEEEEYKRLGRGKEERSVKKVLKEGAHWRNGAYFEGWNEYNDEVHRVYEAYEDSVPYDTLRDVAELIRQIPLESNEKRFGADRDDECNAVNVVIDAAEKIGSAASNAAAQMTVAYPNQANPRGLRLKAQRMTENPKGAFLPAGFGWEWKCGGD